MSNKKTVSLKYEVAEIKHALEGVHLLANALQHDSFLQFHEEKTAPAAISAMLTLVEVRLQLVWGVLEGRIDPSTLWARHNAVMENDQSPDEKDILLGAW